MRRRHSLRFRVAAAFAGLAAVLSLLFALGIWLAAHEVSQRLMDETLRAELEDYIARRSRNPASLPPDTASLRGYVAPVIQGRLDSQAVPGNFRHLERGQHEIDVGGTAFRVSVAERGGERYIMVFNEERQRARERRFLGYLIAGALSMSLLAAGGGYWLAGRVIAPVRELARAVSHAAAENPPRLTVEGQPHDEIDELTRSFDRYMQRLAAFIERERNFAADASHELRTPLAVIGGAAEVLAEDATLSEQQAQRVARIERAANEMSALIAALLLLAREETGPADESCDAAAIVQQVVERYRPLAQRRGDRLELTTDTTVRLAVAPALFAIVVANLVRNAVAHTQGGSIRVALLADRLVVDDTGVGIRAEEIGRVFQRYYRGAASGGAGIGLSLVKRICDRAGWQIELASREAGGTTAALHFFPAP